MRKIIKLVFILSSLTFLISTIWAADDSNLAFRTPGVYMTLGAGVAKTDYANAIQNYMNISDHLPDLLFGDLTEPHDHNFGAVGSIGYIWNRYFDTELSYYYFSGANFSSTWTTTSFNTDENYRILQQAVALTAVGRLPVEGTRSDFYAKLGLAYTWANLRINYTSDSEPASWYPTLNYHRSFSAGSVAPLAGLGWELNFSRHWAMNVEGIAVAPIQHKDLGDIYHTKLQAAYLFSVGGSYKF